MNIFENIKNKLVADFQAEKSAIIGKIAEQAESASDETELTELVRREYTQIVKSAMMEKFKSQMTESDMKILMDLSGSKSAADLLAYVRVWTRHDFDKAVASCQYLRGERPRLSVAPAVILPFIAAQFRDGAKSVQRGQIIATVNQHRRNCGKSTYSDLENPFFSYTTLLGGDKKGLGLLKQVKVGASIVEWTFGPKASKYLSANT